MLRAGAPTPPALLLVIYAHLATFNKVNNKVKNFCQPKLDAAVEVEADVACPKNDNWRKFLDSKSAKVKLATAAAAAPPTPLPPAVPDQRLSVYQQVKQSIQRHFCPLLAPPSSWQLEPLREGKRERELLCAIKSLCEFRLSLLLTHLGFGPH